MLVSKVENNEDSGGNYVMVGAKWEHVVPAEGWILLSDMRAT